ncbi:MAG: preprotein translocase subunit SecE [Fimbriimonadales bacterium]|nr:preprotein translocase subunit SecE [Fimbriimonadales bacterium]MDW8052280.1 preprotein translocase subunit SecE [Armatimonadota bacterium]
MASLKTQTERPGFVARMRTWFNDILAELRRVVKPTPEETTQMMLVVIGFVLIVALWFAFWDAVLTYITTRIETWSQSFGR